MNDAVNKALLPAGLGDLLPPEAEQEAALLESPLIGQPGQRRPLNP